MFSVSDGGKPVAGRLVKPGSSLGGAIGRHPTPGDPRLWMQLEFAPADRGDGVDYLPDPATGGAKPGPAWAFDAWTGRLWSPVVEVAVR